MLCFVSLHDGQITEDGIRFNEAITAAVNAGQRPALPEGCGPAPEGYKELMEACWRTSPEERPGFGDVVKTTEEIRQRLAQHDTRESLM